MRMLMARISLRDFEDCLGANPSAEVQKCLKVSSSYDSRGRKLHGGMLDSLPVPVEAGFNTAICQAMFMKFGHDDHGFLPIDVFVRRLFTGDAHVLSLEGIRQGAFDRDRSKTYSDFQYRWQGKAATLCCLMTTAEPCHCRHDQTGPALLQDRLLCAVGLGG
jgi:hypothetical protein